MILLLLSCQIQQRHSFSVEEKDSELVSIKSNLHCSPDRPNFLEINLGEEWKEQPIEEAGEFLGWGIAVEDFNGDGLWDIFLPQFARQDQLFLGTEAGQVRAGHSLLPENEGLGYG